MLKVRNFTNHRGNSIPNQYRIYTDTGVYFQSYESIICFREKITGLITIDPHWYKYNKTTSRYLHEFLGMTSQEIQNLINLDVIALKKLNITEERSQDDRTTTQS